MNKKRALRLLIILIIILFILVLGKIFIFSNPSIAGKAISLFSSKKTTNTGNQVIVAITKENFHLFLESQQIIKDLPKSSIISLKTYNFDKGQRTIEKTYTITKASVKEGEPSNPDIIILLSSKYIGTSNDLCSLIKTANKNGDLAYELKISKASLLLKYAGIMKYKGCF